MDQPVPTKIVGSYTANLLGNIKSHLAGLQGYDVMALELIQNADDAKADEIFFDITDSGLMVRNSAQFTYCGDLNTRPCKFIAENGYGCDYHRIADVGSGGKLTLGENIGRFGIGFVSTYQITDHPEIHSSGIKLTLIPEEGQWSIEPFKANNTSFFLPWANNPNSEARLALGVSHITPAHIDQLAEDFQTILRKSLLFLRHVRKAEIRRNGELLLKCDLERPDDSNLIASFQPTNEVEKWLILRADAEVAAQTLYKTHPRLQGFERSTKISIGIRISPESLANGLLYAYLPTEQLTGLPLHINADFFPESDRKAVIFAGHQHEQAWNEMLIEAAAIELARAPESLLESLGHTQMWQIFTDVYNLTRISSSHPSCYKLFWEHLSTTTPQSEIALARDGSLQIPRNVFISRSPLNEAQANTLFEIGGRLVSEKLRPFHTIMNHTGSPTLTLERLVTLLGAVMGEQETEVEPVDLKKLETFYPPLWSIINDLIPDTETINLGTNSAVTRLMKLPFIVTEDLYEVTIDQTYVVPASLKINRIVALLPHLAFASHHLLKHPKITRLMKKLELDVVVSHLEILCDREPIEDVISIGENDLRDLYTLFADLDTLSNVEKSTYIDLRNLPIWKSSCGLVKATEALLPGNFNDPTGRARLLDTRAFTETARNFVTTKLGVETQTITSFVINVLPSFFTEKAPVEESNYKLLVSELANHPELIDEEKVRRVLGSLPIVPTQDGGWSLPGDTYRKTDELVKVLGDSKHIWVDSERIPNTRSAHSFIESLGVRHSPNARHLVDRMLFIAKKYLPNDNAKRASSEAFYALCDNYDKWKEHSSFQTAIKDLRHTACFPADDDSSDWYRPDSLYAPFRADSFRSQAKILDFRNTSRLKSELLEKLDVSISPETTLVIRHLQHCIEKDEQPHIVTYQVLNERAKSEQPLVATLAATACIYVESEKSFVRPNQLFWVPQQLGRYVYTIPGSYESFKPLFDAIGVKSAPDSHDLIEILLDIVGEYFEQSKHLTGQDKAVYESCLEKIASSFYNEEPNLPDLELLRTAPSILNLNEQLTHPDEVLIQNSEWHTGFFKGELNQALCAPPPELWQFLENVGVKKLSDCANVTLEYVTGTQLVETPLAEKLIDRKEIIARLLHDKPTAIKQKVRLAFSKLTAVSHDIVRIQATVSIGGHAVSAPPAPVQAYYDSTSGKLILARPVNDRSWAHIFNALFHQLMPEESGSEISKLTLSIRPLIGMTLDDAHRELNDADIPKIDFGATEREVVDLTSGTLSELGTETEEETVEIQNPAALVESEELEDIVQPQNKEIKNSTPQAANQEKAQPVVSSISIASPNAHTKQRNGVDKQGSDGGDGGARRVNTPRAKHKQQWDRRLLSYVKHKQETESGLHEESSQYEHNLAVEVVARKSVCEYEKERGRFAEEMPQTHPGYDITSNNLVTGECRFIEVKSVSGEWNKTGVGLSKLQFSNAQDFGDSYWLYVVEFAGDPENIRIHAIQSPATQVTSFMFDGNWRDAVTEEQADPTALFAPGVRIAHKDMGSGVIQNVSSRGSTILLTILFDGRPQATPNVTLNMHRMRIVEDYDDNDNS